MNAAPGVDPPLPMNIHGARVSTVVVQRIPAEGTQRFLECQRGLTTAVEGFRGYRGTELYPPADGGHQEWVAVFEFDDQESLQNWIDSPARSEWTAKLRDEFGEFQLKTLPSGFSGWFAGLVTAPDGEPPSWKIAITVLLGLYPTVMLLAVLLVPHLSPLGLAVTMLISNTFSVAICQWIVIPPLTRILGPWLHANAPSTRALSIGGTVLIFLFLVGLAVVLRAVTG